MKQLILGNEAVARGLYEAGCSFVSSYPGTPSTEITEAVAKYPEVYAEWAPNEKVAMESAFGASLAGRRAFCGMKHVGLNVAADPLFTISYTGVNGGMVIGVAPDSKPLSLDETPGNGYHQFITGVSYQPITGWGLGSGPTGWPANKKGPDKWPEPAKADQITAPAKTILFAEAQLAADPAKNPTHSNIYIGALKNRTFSKRHNNVNNILAVDGHVANIKSDDLLKWFEKAPAWTRGNSNNYAECPLL